MTKEIKEGSQVGRYTLRSKIARGGMANVWLADATGAGGFQKKVVIKTILPHLAGDPEFVRMFVDEALVASRLLHPNVIQIFDLGECDGSYYIAMEHVAGHSLREIQKALKKARQAPPPWFVLNVMASAADGLYYAHTLQDEQGAHLGLVHRDVSPENIMVTNMGDTKVVDFGIAKATAGVTETQVGVLKGKYAYMAPEQIEGAAVRAAPDPRSDVYAAGVVLYELLSGRRPFRAKNQLALLKQVLEGQVAPLHGSCPWIPPLLSELVAKAMARDPNERFQTALDLRLAIDDYFRSVALFPIRRDVAEYLKELFEGRSKPEAVPASARRIGESGGEAEPEPSVEIVLSGSDFIEEAKPVEIEPALKAVAVDECRESLPEEEPVPSTKRSKGEEEVEPPKAPAKRPVAAGILPRPAGCVEGKPTAAGGAHLWDLLTQRAREAKHAKEPVEASSQESSVAEAEPASTDDVSSRSSGWDIVVSRIRAEAGKTEVEFSEARAESGPRGAGEWFDEGLERWKRDDWEGTLSCWRKATELAPDNRLYRSNLRKLERQIQAREIGETLESRRG